ncbi:MAG: 1-acyl-sn-glycerol-3-phosphate acyltransferase [Ramlibacter sp.]|nr:1-acyl-sn-glycerol-3-phosphate acyltransferase [Cryobacterium sp.]
MTRRASEPLYATAILAGRAVFGLLRLKPSVTGLKNMPDTGGAVLAITHFGYMDFALVEWMLWHKNKRHIRFMAKKGAFDQKLVGVLLRGMRHISVDMKAGAEAYAQAVSALKEGELLGVFPEGGVNASFTVRELKSGAIRMAAEAQVPVIPIAVWGGHRLLTKNHKPSLREASGVPICFAVGEPFTVPGRPATGLPATQGEDAQSLTQALHDTLQGLVDGLQAAYPVDGTGQWWQPRHLGGTAPTPEEAAVAEAERRRLRDAKSESAGTSA